LPEALVENKVLEWERDVGPIVEGVHFERLFVLKEGLHSSFLCI
jgi:hypothetical protein